VKRGNLPPSLTQCCPQSLVSCTCTSSLLFSQIGMVFACSSFVSLVHNYRATTLIVVVDASGFSVSTSASIKGVVSSFLLASFGSSYLSGWGI